jgi:pilus assembly protein CpaE
MIYIIIVAVGVLGVLLLGNQAMSTPSPRKTLKRRVELIKERHGEGGALEISKKDFEQSIERDVDIVFPDDRKVAAQAAKLGKPMAEIATGKMAAPFTQLANMVLSHASEEGVTADGKAVAGAKSLVDNLKSMLAKPKDKAA